MDSLIKVGNGGVTAAKCVPVGLTQDPWEKENVPFWLEHGFSSVSLKRDTQQHNNSNIGVL